MVVTDVLSHPFLMLCYGILANVLGGLMEVSKPGAPAHPSVYIRERPYRVALGVIAAFAGYGVLASTGQLTGISAFGVAYLGVDALDKLSNAAGNRLTG